MAHEQRRDVTKRSIEREIVADARTTFPPVPPKAILVRQGASLFDLREAVRVRRKP